MMTFCDECNNMMFPVEDVSDMHNKKLVYKCKHCSNKMIADTTKNEKQACVYENFIQMEEETNIDAIVNPDVTMDPTLPRTRDIECPRCGGNEAVFFDAQSKNPDEAMNLIFICCKEGCHKYWKKQTSKINKKN